MGGFNFYLRRAVEQYHWIAQIPTKIPLSRFQTLNFNRKLRDEINAENGCENTILVVYAAEVAGRKISGVKNANIAEVLILN